MRAAILLLLAACAPDPEPELVPAQPYVVEYPRLVTAPPELAAVTQYAVGRWNEAAGEPLAAWSPVSGPGVAEVVAVPPGSTHRVVEDDGLTRIEVSPDCGSGLMLHELGHYLLVQHLVAPGSCMGVTDNACEIAQESIDQALRAKRRHTWGDGESR